jgi:hypothetical protein
MIGPLLPHQGTNQDRLTEMILLATLLAAVANLAAACFIYLELLHSRKSEVTRATTAIFEEWWSIDMRKNREALFRDFIPNERARFLHENKSMKDVGSNTEKGSVIALVHFFDRVGWLGAAELIDVDYILGPMQHVMRRTWVAMFPLIEKERRFRESHRLDPVYNYGFEWLYKYSSEPENNQAELLRRRCRASSVLSKDELKKMKLDIDLDEKTFESYLHSLQVRFKDQVR